MSNPTAKRGWDENVNCLLPVLAKQKLESGRGLSAIGVIVAFPTSSCTVRLCMLTAGGSKVLREGGLEPRLGVVMFGRPKVCQVGEKRVQVE